MLQGGQFLSSKSCTILKREIINKNNRIQVRLAVMQLIFFGDNYGTCKSVNVQDNCILIAN